MITLYRYSYINVIENFSRPVKNKNFVIIFFLRHNRLIYVSATKAERLDFASRVQNNTLSAADRAPLASPRYAIGCNEPLRCKAFVGKRRHDKETKQRIETHTLWRSARLGSGQQLQRWCSRSIIRVIPSTPQSYAFVSLSALLCVYFYHVQRTSISFAPRSSIRPSRN